MDQELLVFILVGFTAQLIDGTLGMAYGISANVILLNLGIPPVHASAAIHTAEIFTTAASGASHYGFGNVDHAIVRKLIVPGAIGAAIGAVILIWIPAWIIKPVIAGYLLVMGIFIIRKMLGNRFPVSQSHNLVSLGFFGGLADAAGGGGWGSIVASTLVSKGSIPRLAVGSVNVSEFFVALTSSIIFFLSLDLIYWKIILGLAIGGALAAPLGAYIVKLIPTRHFTIVIGTSIILLSLRTLYLFFSN